MSFPSPLPNPPTKLEQAREIIRLQQLRLAELEKKAARVDELELNVEELTRQLAELLDKQGSTSRNSSKPPSSDSPEPCPPDEEHSEVEERWVTLGMAENRKPLLVVHTYIEVNTNTVTVRMISARPATKHEQHQYKTG